MRIRGTSKKAKNDGIIAVTRFVRRRKTKEKGKNDSRLGFGKRLAIPSAVVSDNIAEERMITVSTQTKLPRTAPKKLEAQPQSLLAAANAAPSEKRKTYWGDRLTLQFWLLCFGLMLAMNLVEAVHRLVLFWIERFSTP